MTLGKPKTTNQILKEGKIKNWLFKHFTFLLLPDGGRYEVLPGCLGQFIIQEVFYLEFQF
jgi:hypothetical protein